MDKKFANREEGGRALAAKLVGYKNRRDVVVLALPRGGVPVASEVAKALNAPFDVFIVRKLGVPFREELAFGAVAPGDIAILNKSLMETFRIPDSLVKKVFQKEKAELERREKVYRANRPALTLREKTVIIVDDGLATGATMRAALVAVRQSQPKKIIVAAPVAARDTCRSIIERPNESCICVMTPEPFYGVGMWYRNFEQITDREVCHLLERSENVRVESMPIGT